MDSGGLLQSVRVVDRFFIIQMYDPVRFLRDLFNRMPKFVALGTHRRHIYDRCLETLDETTVLNLAKGDLKTS